MVLVESGIGARSRPQELPKPQINIEALVNRAKTGDEQAYAELDALLDRKLRNGFSSMGNLAPDLLQEAKIQIFTNLDTFDPALGKIGDFNRDWFTWACQIAINVRRSEFRKQKRRPRQGELDESRVGEVVLEVNQESELNEPRVNFSKLIATKVDKLIVGDPNSGSQRRVVKLGLQGLNNHEIAATLGLKEISVRVLLSKARKIIERELIFPAGYQRPSSFVDEDFSRTRLSQAIRQGRLEGVKFLNLYYATPEAVALYKARTKLMPRPGDQSLISKGYALAYDVATSGTEYEAITRSDFAIKSKGRVYINPEDLAALRVKRNQRKIPRSFIKPPEGFADPILITNSRREYYHVRRAVITGKIRSERVRNRFFVIEEEAKRILAERDARKASRG